MNKRSMDIAHPKYDPDSKPTKPPVEKAAPKQKTVTINKPEPVIKSDSNSNTEEGKRDVFWPVYFVGVIIVAILAFFGVRAGAKLVDTWMDLKPTSVSTEPATTSSEPAAESTESAPALTMAEESAATEAQTAAETPSEAPSTPATPAIDKASLKIKVLNGSGVNGAASEAQKVLEEAGFKIAATGNARNFNYESSYVYYPSGKSAEANLVSESIKDKYSVTTEENSVADGYDALVVIGKK